METSLLNLHKQRYLDTLRSVKSRWKILIVDEHTNTMLKSVLTTFDILEEGVQQVDVITATRTPQPNLDAIYLLMPTSQNVALILKDYAPGEPLAAQPRTSKKNAPPPPRPDPPKYAAAHLHFVDGIDDGLVSRLTAGLPGNYLQALTELYVNFHAVERRAFSLRSPRSFFTLYAPPERSPKESLQLWEEEIAWMSRALVNALATLGEYPLIRYYNPPTSFHAPLGPALAAGEHVGKRLAHRLQAELDAYARDNSDFPPIPDPPRPRGVLFITDRSMDLYAPLLHEFTYQAMCNDLLDIEDGTKYHYSFRNAAGTMEEKEAILTDDDKVWTEIRHMHMKDALDKLVADFKAYAGDHNGQFGSEGGTSLNDMRDMLASLPQLREAKEKLSLHLTMAEKCMGLFESKKLPLCASVEQCCATGVTPEGKTPKTLVEEMVPLLDDRSVSSSDKLRIIALYIMHRDGVPEGDKKRLYQHARLALHEMDAVNNLIYLGVNVSKDSGKKRKALFKQRNEDDAYDISRYQPTIKYMLEEHFAGTLDQTIFPYVRHAPPPSGSSSSDRPTVSTSGSLRSARPQWTSSRGRKPVNEPRQRVIVFVAGGLAYSEIRAAYKVSEAHNKDVFIGSTNIVTPEQFVTDLSNLDRGGGAALAIHGKSGFTYDAPKKSSKSPPSRAADLPQAALDRRFASSSSSNGPPSQYNPLPPQQPPQPQQHRPATLTRAQPPPQAQANRQPDRFQSQAGYYSGGQQPSSPAPTPPEAPSVKPVKKKKLFGF